MEAGAEMEMEEGTQPEMGIAKGNVDCDLDNAVHQAAQRRFVSIWESPQNKFAAIRFLFATICVWR
jgi:hypothetical protein